MDCQAHMAHTCAMTQRREMMLTLTAGIALAGVFAVTSLSWLWLGLIR